MLGVWIAKGSPQYPWQAQGQHIAYISTIGASSWGKPLFIAGSCTMIVLFNLTFALERWLRHKGRLTKNYNITEKILSGFATGFAIIGGFGLIFLTIFDTRRYPNVHQAMLAVFIGGYIISAVFICAEYQRLGMHFREHRILRSSFWIKLTFIFVEGGLAIAFGVLERGSSSNKAAILEWVVSLIYICYVWSFIIDFLPATRTRNKEDRFGPPIRADDDEMAMNTQAAGNNMGGPVYTAGGHTQYGETSSYNSALPMTEAPRNVPASRNF